MRFVPEDFQDLCAHWQHAAEQSARIANARLERWLATAPTVYLDMGDCESVLYGTEFDETTHQAKLVCIEEIKP